MLDEDTCMLPFHEDIPCVPWEAPSARVYHIKDAGALQHAHQHSPASKSLLKLSYDSPKQDSNPCPVRDRKHARGCQANTFK
jgi:hypothetical protein